MTGTGEIQISKLESKKRVVIVFCVYRTRAVGVLVVLGPISSGCQGARALSAPNRDKLGAEVVASVGFVAVLRGP